MTEARQRARVELQVRARHASTPRVAWKPKGGQWPWARARLHDHAQQRAHEVLALRCGGGGGGELPKRGSGPGGRHAQVNAAAVAVDVAHRLQGRGAAEGLGRGGAAARRDGARGRAPGGGGGAGLVNVVVVAARRELEHLVEVCRRVQRARRSRRAGGGSGALGGCGEGPSAAAR